MRRVGIKPLVLTLAVLFMASILVCGLDLAGASHLDSHSGDSCLLLGTGGAMGLTSLPLHPHPAIPMTVTAFLTLTIFFSSAGPYSSRPHRSPLYQALSHKQRLACIQTFLS